MKTKEQAAREYSRDGIDGYSLSEYTKYGFENCACVIEWKPIEL